ncbi:MAG: sortase [Chloroflexi bacterium]|nr:sortase [Chloroflexota bacterium]
MDYTLDPDEQVYGAAEQWADLSVTLTASPTSLHPGDTAVLTVTVHNDGPYPADGVEVAVDLPPEVTFQRANSGDYDPATGLWTLPAPLAVGASQGLEITVTVANPGVWDVQAQITSAGPADIDSAPSQGFDEDDLADGQADDDEAQVQLVVLDPVLPETGFPHRSQVAGFTQAAVPAARMVGQAALWLEVPALGIQAPVQGVPLTSQGWDVSWLGDEVGWLEGSAFPTRAGNTVLVGHVWNADNTPGVFAGLKTLGYDDLIVVHAWGQRYVYAVREKQVLRPEDVRSLWAPRSYDWLTLLTCADYDPQADTYQARLAVYAVLVAVTPDDNP